MAKSRYASAVGVAVALGELKKSPLDVVVRSEAHWSSKASCSAGAELEDCHILIVASDPSSEIYVQHRPTWMKRSMQRQS